jgi:hypothetical protein
MECAALVAATAPTATAPLSAPPKPRFSKREYQKEYMRRKRALKDPPAMPVADNGMANSGGGVEPPSFSSDNAHH